MRITSPALDDGRPIPSRFTCDGDDHSPPLRIEDVPAGTRSLALIVDDPDAPRGTFVHWLVWNLPPDTDLIPETEAGSVDLIGDAVHGRNDFGDVGYRGPCPPDGEHRYRFHLHALDRELELEPGSARSELEQAMEGRVLAEAELQATYAREVGARRT